VPPLRVQRDGRNLFFGAVDDPAADLFDVLFGRLGKLYDPFVFVRVQNPEFDKLSPCVAPPIQIFGANCHKREAMGLYSGMPKHQADLLLLMAGDDRLHGLGLLASGLDAIKRTTLKFKRDQRPSIGASTPPGAATTVASIARPFLHAGHCSIRCILLRPS
jgi:hypothetical protein